MHLVFELLLALGSCDGHFTIFCHFIFNYLIIQLLSNQQSIGQILK